MRPSGAITTIFKQILPEDYKHTHLLGLLASAWFAYMLLRTYFAKTLPLPPSPRRLPILGNLHQAPLRDHWTAYKNWHKKYGPIICLHFGQRTLVSLGSHSVAKDLLEKRSQWYSSRLNPNLSQTSKNNIRRFNAGAFAHLQI